MGAPVAATAEAPRRLVPYRRSSDDDPCLAGQRVEGSGNRLAACPTCASMTNQRSVARVSLQYAQFFHEFFVKLVAASGVNDDQISG